MPVSPRDLLLHALDEAYDRPAWHGPNLKSCVRRLPLTLATWRPSPERKCIAEITLHTAYWKYTVRRRILQEKRGGFVVRGSNWFALPDPFDDAAWRTYRRILDDEHTQLRAAVSGLRIKELDEIPTGSRSTYRQLVLGVAAHDVYHAGQIRYLRSLAPDDVTGAPRKAKQASK